MSVGSYTIDWELAIKDGIKVWLGIIRDDDRIGENNFVLFEVRPQDDKFEASMCRMMGDGDHIYREAGGAAAVCEDFEDGRKKCWEMYQQLLMSL